MTALKNGSRLTLLPMGTWNHELGTWIDQMMQPMLGVQKDRHPEFSAPLSIWETDTHYHFEFDLPGVELPAIDMKLEQNVLHISAMRPVRADVEVIRQERGFGKIERQISLPERIDDEQIEATLNSGVLAIRIAKAPEAQVRKIEIKSN